MDEAAKGVWNGKAAADKERYEAEMKAYRAKANAAADDDSDDEAPAGSDSD